MSRNLYSDNIEANVIKMEQMQDRIETALEAIDPLYEVGHFLSSPAGKTPSGRDFALAAADNLFKLAKIGDPVKEIPSLEKFGKDEISTEGFVDGIKKVFRKIVDAIGRVWNWIKGLFGKSSTNNSSDSSAAESTDKKIEQFVSGGGKFVDPVRIEGKELLKKITRNGRLIEKDIISSYADEYSKIFEVQGELIEKIDGVVKRLVDIAAGNFDENQVQAITNEVKQFLESFVNKYKTFMNPTSDRTIVDKIGKKDEIKPEYTKLISKPFGSGAYIYVVYDQKDVMRTFRSGYIDYDDSYTRIDQLTGEDVDAKLANERRKHLIASIGKLQDDGDKYQKKGTQLFEDLNKLANALSSAKEDNKGIGRFFGKKQVDKYSKDLVLDVRSLAAFAQRVVSKPIVPYLKFLTEMREGYAKYVDYLLEVNKVSINGSAEEQSIRAANYSEEQKDLMSKFRNSEDWYEKKEILMEFYRKEEERLTNERYKLTQMPEVDQDAVNATNDKIAAVKDYIREYEGVSGKYSEAVDLIRDLRNGKENNTNKTYVDAATGGITMLEEILGKYFFEPKSEIKKFDHDGFEFSKEISQAMTTVRERIRAAENTSNDDNNDSSNQYDNITPATDQPTQDQVQKDSPKTERGPVKQPPSTAVSAESYRRKPPMPANWYDDNNDDYGFE